MPTSTIRIPTQASIGGRVRLARDQAGLRQEDLAAHLGIPRPSVSEIEAGRRDVSSVELAKLAEYLGKPLGWFVAVGDSFDPRAWDPSAFRLRGGDLDERDTRVLLDFARRALDYAQLEQLLGIRTGLARPPHYGERRGRHIDQGRAVAAEERQRLGLGVQPIADVVALLERQGVKVLDVNMPDESRIDGALFVSDETGPCVMLNRAKVMPRRQFTAAHEYAHLLFDIDGEQAEVCFGDRTALAEKRANAFAAEFLSPTDGVREFLAARGKSSASVTVGDVIALQMFFNLSFDATLWRLLNLGFLDERSREAMSRYRPTALARALGYEVRDATASGAVSSRFVQLALQAWQAGKITRGKLAELLGIPRHELEVGLPDTLAALSVA